MSVRNLVIVALLLGGLAWWFTHRSLTEAQVAGFYRSQVDAFLNQDSARLCAQVAPDYHGVERQSGPTGVQVVQADRELACRNYDFLFEFKKQYEAKLGDGSILAREFHLDPTEIEIAKDGKSATVHLDVHLDFGGAFIAEGKGTEHLVLRGGKVLSVGSEMDSRVSGPLAAGIDPASLMAPSGR